MLWDWVGMSGVGMSRGWVPTSPLEPGTLDNTGYGRLAGGTHPTGMLSCCNCLQDHC